VLPYLAALGCVMFVVFHQIVARVGSGAIRINGRDLERIQAALRLSDPGDYVEAKPIYDWFGTEWIPQAHFRFLTYLNIGLAVGLIALLAFQTRA
jgi:hypothetical protein